MGEQWEYKIVHVLADRWTGTGLPSDLNVQFDDLGSEGWELVGTQGMIRPCLMWTASKTVGVVAFFKRRLQ
jgi:hypothetical protein